jgi:putative ABC transport system ATP-binding protein
MTEPIVELAPTVPGVPVVPPAVASLIQWEAVTKDAETTGTPPVLEATDLCVEMGTYVALIGAPGSGVSTLFNILGLLERASSGRYLLSGLDVDHLKDDERAAQRAQTFGFVLPEAHLLEHRTVRENVELGLLYAGVGSDERRDRATDLLGRVGLFDRLEAEPGTLSGGERQRVVMGRAMMRAPKMLLCDEPTGNLSKAESEEVLDLLDAFHGDGTAVFVVSRDHSVAERASRTLEMHDGVIASCGTAADRP